MLFKVTCKVIDNITWLNSTNYDLSDIKDVAVWRINIAEHVEKSSSYHFLLSPDELQRAGRYHQQKDKDRFVVSRGVLRILLGKYLNQSPADIVFEIGANKKPFVKNTGGKPVHYNTSHSAGVVLIAIGNAPLGIDVEQRDSAFPFTEILEHSFNTTEIQHIEQSATATETFYKLWTRKEALLKATGKGIDDDMKQVPSLDGEHSVDENIIGSSQNWCVHTFNAEPGYTCSLAIGLQGICFVDLSS